MGYSSDLTDKEWEIIEPLLPQKKKTRPPVWTKRQLLNGIFYQLKNGCPKGYRFAYNWADLPRDLPPYSTVFWHYQNWCSEGAIDLIMTKLHRSAREQVKKNQNGQPSS
jgi:transposase